MHLQRGTGFIGCDNRKRGGTKAVGCILLRSDACQDVSRGQHHRRLHPKVPQERRCSWVCCISIHTLRGLVILICTQLYMIALEVGCTPGTAPADHESHIAASQRCCLCVSPLGLCKLLEFQRLCVSPRSLGAIAATWRELSRSSNAAHPRTVVRTTDGTAECTTETAKTP